MSESEPTPATPVEVAPNAEQEAAPVNASPDVAPSEVSEDFVPESEGDAEGIKSIDNGKDD